MRTELVTTLKRKATEVIAQLVIPPIRLFYRVQKEEVYLVYVMRGERLFRNEDLLEREAR